MPDMDPVLVCANDEAANKAAQTTRFKRIDFSSIGSCFIYPCYPARNGRRAKHSSRLYSSDWNGAKEISPDIHETAVHRVNKQGPGKGMLDFGCWMLVKT